MESNRYKDDGILNFLNTDFWQVYLNFHDSYMTTNPIETSDRLSVPKSIDALNPLNVGHPGLLLIEYQSEDGEQHVTGVVAQQGGVLSTLAGSDKPIVLASLLTPATRYLDEAVARFGRIDQENKLDRVLKFVHILEPGLKRLSAIPRFAGLLSASIQ